MDLKILKRFYLGTIFALIALIIFTPLLIKGKLFFIDEEPLEALSIGFLFLIGLILNLLYERELRSNKNYLQEAWAHIGKINILTDAFKDALINIEKHPESKEEMKKLLDVIAEKILSITSTPFILLRIIIPTETKTLCEHLQLRNEADKFEFNFSNKQLIENTLGNKYGLFSSTASNIKIKAYCVLAETKLSPEQEIFVQKIVNDLAMVYLIYHNSKSNFKINTNTAAA